MQQDSTDRLGIGRLVIVKRSLNAENFDFSVARVAYETDALVKVGYYSTTLERFCAGAERMNKARVVAVVASIEQGLALIAAAESIYRTASTEVDAMQSEADRVRRSREILVLSKLRSAA